MRLKRALDVVALLLQRRFAHPGLGVMEVEVASESELHRRGLRHSLLEVAFPDFRFAPCAKAPLRLPLRNVSPVLVPEVREPGSALLVLASCHDYSFSM